MTLDYLYRFPKRADVPPGKVVCHNRVVVGITPNRRAHQLATVGGPRPSEHWRYQTSRFASTLFCLNAIARFAGRIGPQSR